MHFIDPKTLLQQDWSPAGSTKFIVPNSVSSICGHQDCGQKVTFSISVKALDQSPPYSACMEGICPACRKESKFFAVGLSNGGKTKLCDSIWQYPVPNIRNLVVQELPDKKIFNSYKHAVDAFNQRMYPLSLVACGRVLEGIGKTKFPNASAVKQIAALFNTLRKELKKTPEYIEILQPLLELGEALRIGRNPGGHFDLEVEPSRELADKVIDLTEFFLRYIYVISDETSKINDIISNLSRSNTDQDN